MDGKEAVLLGKLRFRQRTMIEAEHDLTDMELDIRRHRDVM
jgi:hypothetical protein